MKGLIINVGRQFGSGGKLVALEIGHQERRKKEHILLLVILFATGFRTDGQLHR